MRTYEIIIREKNSILTGELIEYHGNRYKSAIFNPLTILGDLCFFTDNMTFDTSQVNFTREVQSLIETPYSVETCFGIPLCTEHNVKYFFLLDTLSRYVLPFRRISYYELYSLKSFFEISARHCKISERGQLIPTKETNSFTEYTHFRYGQDDVVKIFNNAIPQNSESQYSCHTASDIIFSVLHCLITHGYSFKQCKHCEKYFATKHRNTKYCGRNSPLPKYTHYTCKNAVKECKKSVTNKHHTLENKLRKKGKLSNFPEQYDKRRKLVDKNPTVKNLETLLEVVDKKTWGI